jgi:hypothetical protein
MSVILFITHMLDVCKDIHIWKFCTFFDNLINHYDYDIDVVNGAQPFITFLNTLIITYGKLLKIKIVLDSPKSK